jgi:hypothetical protein
MTTKILTGILSLTIIVKFISWISFDIPVNRSSVLVIMVLITVLNFKNKFTWNFGLLFIVCAIIAMFTNFNIGASDAWSINPFFFLDSIKYSLRLKTNNILFYLFNIFTLLFFLFLLITFLTPKFKRKYLPEKTTDNQVDCPAPK